MSFSELVPQWPISYVLTAAQNVTAMPVGGVRACTHRDICVPPPAPLRCGFYGKGIWSGGFVFTLQRLLKSPSSLQTNPDGSAAALP